MGFTGAAPDGAPRGMPRAGQRASRPGQVRTWHFFHRHTVLSMCALALLAAAADPGMVKGSVPEARRLLRLGHHPRDRRTSTRPRLVTTAATTT